MRADPFLDGGRPLEDDRDLGCFDVRVVDAEARPVAALVLATEDVVQIEGAQPWRGEVRTGPGGRGVVCAPAGAHAYVDAWDDDGRWGREAHYVRDSGDGRPQAPLVVRVAEPTVVTGRVLDEAGAPLAGARVGVYAYDGSSPRWLGVDLTHEVVGERAPRSDPDGRFELSIGRFGLYAIGATHPEHRDGFAGPVPARGGGRVEVEVRVRPAAILSGRVLHAGEPIAGASVTITHGHGLMGMSSDADGGFTSLPLDPAQRVQLRVAAEGYVARTLDVAPGHRDVELELAARLAVTVRPSAALGRCVPPLDEASRGRRSLGYSQPLGVDASGVAARVVDPAEPVVLDGLAPGQTTVRVLGAGEGEATVDLVAGRTTRVTIDADFPPDHGAVLVTAPLPDEEPLPRPVVTVSLRGPPIAALLDRYGRACLGLPAGSHVVHLGHERFGATGNVDVEPGQVSELHLELEPLDPPPRPATDPPRFCEPRIDWIHEPDGSIVARTTGPSVTAVRPGDRLVAVDGVEASGPWELGGEPDTTVTLDVERPDGTRARVVLDRDSCS